MNASSRFATAFVTLIVVGGPVSAQSGESNARGWVWRQCDEDVLTLNVDPVPLQQFIGSEFTVLVTDGRALVIIVVQDCSSSWINGVELGATQEVHEWVAIEGLRDVRPVPGAQLTLPTLTWFTLFTGSSSDRSRTLFTASGTPTLPIESLSLEPFAPEQRGRLTGGRDWGYSWDARSAPPLARLVAVNHDVYVRDSTGATVLNRIQALLNVFAWDSPGTLKVVGGTNPNRLIDSGTYPIRVHTFRPIWARASLGEPLPR